MKIVKWLDYKEVDPGKRPEQSIWEGMTRRVGSFSICYLTAFNLSTLVKDRPSRWKYVYLPPSWT